MPPAQGVWLTIGSERTDMYDVCQGLQIIVHHTMALQTRVRPGLRQEGAN